MTRRRIGELALIGSLTLGGWGLAGCGKASVEDPALEDPVNVEDGGSDSSVGEDGSAPTDGGDAPADSGTDSGTDAGGHDCLKLGSLCGSSGECCSGMCKDDVCSVPSCTSDQGACTSDGDCCSGNCEDGACVALNPACKTLGNECSGANECCSGRCADGTCQPSSFCGQQGDACSGDADCCGGICNIASGSSKGTCAKPSSGSANCDLVDGELCSDGAILDDGGVPTCGGKCCSRACAPWGPTGVFVCQPASGCRVVGDTCTKDSDCCGSEGMPVAPQKPVTCVIEAGKSVGVCRNPQGCAPDGAVCKLATMSCNATCDCCSGNCNQVDSCKQDSLGAPRCAGVECVQPGGACASSANCCDGLPCVPNPDESGPPFVCFAGGSCVPKCGACTTNADCCPGSSCIAQPGGTQGVCGPCTDAETPDGGAPDDAGTPDGDAPCSLYGQQCETDGDCCNGVPCTNGTCYYQIR